MSEQERDQFEALLTRLERVASLMRAAWAVVFALISVAVWGAIDRQSVLDRLSRVETYGSQPMQRLDERLDEIRDRLTRIEARLGMPNGAEDAR